MSVEVTAEFAKELQDVEAISREVKETTETIKQAADIKSMLVESVGPALTVGESREEPRIADAQETTSQAEVEKKGTVGDEETSTRAATVVKENETEDHE